MQEFIDAATAPSRDYLLYRARRTRMVARTISNDQVRQEIERLATEYEARASAPTKAIAGPGFEAMPS